MVSAERRERVLQRFAAQLARETRQTPEAVRAQLQEAIDAGLLRVTRTGLQATIPPDVEDER